MPEDKFASLINAYDWSATDVGHPANWDTTLKNAVRLILDCAFPMRILWGRDLICIYNEPYIALIGDKHPGAMGKPMQDIWPEIWPELHPHINEALQGNTVYFENRPFIIKRNGRSEQLWTTFSYSPIYGDDGKIGGVYGVATETTARAMVERRQMFQLTLADKLRELTRPEEITQSASHLLGDYFSVARVGYADVDINRATVSVQRDWTDGTIPTLAGQSRLLESFGPDVIDELKAGRTLIIHDAARDSRATPYAAAYRSIGMGSCIIVPLLEGGELTAFLYLHEAAPRTWNSEETKVAEDTARRTWEAVKRARAEEALRDETRILEILNRTGQMLASTLDLQSLLQSITDAATELSGAKFGAFFYTEQDDRGDVLLLYTLSGAPREAFEKFGKPRATALFGPTFQGHPMIRSDDILTDERYGKMAPHHGMPQGHLPVRSYMAMPVKSRSGEVLGGLFFGHPEPGVFTERTERLISGLAAQAGIAVDNARLYEAAQKSAREREHLLNSERTARAEAEKLSKMKDEFLAMLAHELRNPLAPITTAAEMLKLASLDKERIRKTSDIITRQVNHMTELVDDLLDVSRVTRGLVTLQKETVDIKSVAAEAIEQASALIEKKHLHFATEVADEDMMVFGDRTRLVQILANILNNAAKYTPANGHITLRLGKLEGQVRITVEDDGIGISSELLPHVFDLFTQAERSSDRSQGGLGLGLTLVKSLTALHGGSVGVHSDGVGKGSRFTACFPVASGNMKERTNQDTGPASGRQRSAKRMLVVDDNADAALSLSMMLETMGYKVSVEHDARAALEKARHELPEILFLDIGLPEIDGYELARRLRTLPGMADVKLIAVTGYGQPEDKERAAKAGFDHHLVKPIRLEYLLNLIR